jgi:hypothetical protein
MHATTAYAENKATGIRLTEHARERMTQRRISPGAVEAALEYGRELHLRGALIYAIGRREVERYRTLGVDLSDLDGLQVVCAPSGAVVTTYRNRDFSGLRPSRRASRSRRTFH